MKIVNELQSTLIRLVLMIFCLAYVLPVSADSQFQSCLDQTLLANGWTQTEEVTELVCPNSNIYFLDGIQVFTNLIKLEVENNRILSASPLDQMPQLEVLDLSDNLLYVVDPLIYIHTYITLDS